MKQDPTTFDFIDDEPFVDDLEEDPRPKRSLDRVSNEFATVETAVIEVPGGALLSLYDVRHGRTIILDALQLEAITRLDIRDFTTLVDPNFRGLTNSGVERPHLAAIQDRSQPERNS